MIFNMSGGGGGASLNFAVVGGTSEPANPTENTIWINTDAEITSWIFSAEEPSPAEEGMVWFRVGTSSAVTFNALKKNNIQIYPISAKQYISGAWVSVNAESYQGGEWKAWIVYLYNNGDECENVSGGFEGQAFKPSGVTSSSITYPTFTKNADSMTVSISQYYYGQVFAKNSFPLDDISAIEVVYSNASTGTFLVTDTKGHGYTAAASAKPSGSGTAVIDVSNLTGDYYFAISMAYTAGSVTIHEIRLV